MSGPLFAVTGGPRLWYVHSLYRNGGRSDPVGGPYNSREFAESERQRIAAPYAADGVVFLGLDDGVVFSVGESFRAADQHLSLSLVYLANVSEVSPWVYLPASNMWERKILFAPADGPKRTVTQLVRRVLIRKESK